MVVDKRTVLNENRERVPGSQQVLHILFHLPVTMTATAAKLQMTESHQADH